MTEREPSPAGTILIALLIGIVLALMWFGPLLLIRPANAAETCMASYYGGGRGERLARHTASGEVFDHRQMTAAHRSLRFGTMVRVTLGSRSVVVRINDRGPARYTGRCIDLSRGAASSLGFIRAGTARVRVDVLR